jgi:DNA polymerase beta
MPRPKGSKNKKRKNTNSNQSQRKKTSSEKGKNDKKTQKRNKDNNKTRKKKTFIIESSSSLVSPGIKKIESIFFDNTGVNKTDLKMNQSMNTMIASPVNTNVLPSGRLNEKFIDIMEQLANIMLKQGEPFRARAYQKAQETIMAYPTDILSPNDLKGKPGIGSTIMEKLEEYVKTGTLRVLEREKTNPVNILADVYGIGPKKAKELVDKGITTIEKLRENQQLLNEIQKVGLTYYEDVLKRIPRSEIEEYEQFFDNNFKKVSNTPKSRFEIVGSYRRGAQSSGDIDVIITSENPKVFVNFIDELIKQKIILEVLSRGPTKCLVIAKIPSSDSARRVDFLYTSLDEFPFAILYFTGSKIFNTVMRHQALQMGLTMNEHGLYTLHDGKKKGDKVEWSFKDEKDIFDYLGLVYKSPVERVDGRAVIKMGQPLQTEELQQVVEADKEKPTKLTKTIKKKDITIKAKQISTDKKITLSGSFIVSLDKFKVEKPSMLGISVDDNLVMDFKTVFDI